jgi:hypothetical protein
VLRDYFFGFLVGLVLVFLNRLLYVVVAVLSFDVGGGKICNKLLQKERKSLTITIQFKLANKRVQEDVSDLRI